MRRIGIAVALLTLVGCDRHSDTTASPATHPAASARVVQQTTQPATRPASYLTVDEKKLEFPAAKVVLRKKTGELGAILCTDDPAIAINPGYTGNSYMFEMTLDIDEPADLPTAVWNYKAPKATPQDSSNGIYLNGSRRQLQPLDVKISFAKQSDGISANIDGTFLMFDTHDTASPTQKVHVAGTVDTIVSER